MMILARYLKEATQGHSKVNAKLLHSFEVLMPTKFFLLLFDFVLGNHFSASTSKVFQTCSPTCESNGNNKQ